jgi:hypothetical protein
MMKGLIKMVLGLFFVFLILKLSGIGVVAEWSWWWVASPVWIIVLFELILFGVRMYCLKRMRKRGRDGLFTITTLSLQGKIKQSQDIENRQIF